MIYTIGLAGLSVVELTDIMSSIGACRLVDVRGNPHTRRGLSAAVLDAADLGRTPLPYLAGLKWQPSRAVAIARWRECRAQGVRDGDLVACQCAAPGDCHRLDIASGLVADGFTVSHIFGDEIVDHVELVASIAEDRDYVFRRLEIGPPLAE